MDSRAHLLALVAPVEIGDEIAAGFRLIGAQAELGLWLTFEHGGAAIHVEVTPAEEGARRVAASDRFAFAYRSGRRERHVAPDVGVALCNAVAAAARRNERAVAAAVARDAATVRESEEVSARIREVRVERLLAEAGSPPDTYYTLSPYVGCLIGCRFCYAQRPVATVRRFEGAPDVAWGSYVDVRVNAADVLAAELRALAPRPIKFCPIVSDPYHAVERRYRLTRACLATIRDAGWPGATMLLTRSAEIASDAALIGSLPLSYAGVSVPTIDDDVRRHFEPRGAPVSERFDALRRLRAEGVHTFAVVQPLLPGSIAALADALARTVESVSVDVLEGVEGAEREFADPRYAEASDARWQVERASELRDALVDRGVEVWPGELPRSLRIGPPAPGR